MTVDPAFFGYGSLVNVATHGYPDPTQATLPGWRRVWRSTTLRDFAFLSVEPDTGSQIDGLIARVPGADWAALDAREAAYARVDVTRSLTTEHPTAVYKVHSDLIIPGGKNPILLSYLDVVVQGYLHSFGPDGVARFFASTVGWDRPIHDDRDAPKYPRHQHLAASERHLIDQCLATIKTL